MSNNKKNRFITRIIILTVLAGAVVFTIYSSFTNEKHDILKVEDVAPDFALGDLDGVSHRL